MRLLLLIVWRRRDELESQTGRHPHTRVASVINPKKTPQHHRPGVERTRGQFRLRRREERPHRETETVLEADTRLEAQQALRLRDVRPRVADVPRPLRQVALLDRL